MIKFEARVAERRLAKCTFARASTDLAGLAVFGSSSNALLNRFHFVLILFAFDVSRNCTGRTEIVFADFTASLRNICLAHHTYLGPFCESHPLMICSPTFAVSVLPTFAAINLATFVLDPLQRLKECFPEFPHSMRALWGATATHVHQSSTFFADWETMFFDEGLERE